MRNIKGCHELSRHLSIREKWEELLNKDLELKRRLGGFPEWHGGPVPYPGEGPYPRPIYNGPWDPSSWTEKKGYPSTILHENDLIQIVVPEKLSWVVSLRNSVFTIRDGKAENPCLYIEMPLDLFKDMLLTKYRVVWALADERVKLMWREGIGLSDWITILEVLVVAQEAVDRDPALWNLVEGL
ncbi:MAG: hypothetical protein QFX33_00120 [Candidatus Nezhaarchaeota archaeon]|nr:hypothetical protein [Candidatus Nezhaarchaeota archaeon]